MTRRLGMLVGLVAMVVALALAAMWLSSTSSVEPDPDAIVLAMFPAGREERWATDADVIDAIKRYGNYSARSPTHRIDFVTAAVINDRHLVLDYLLANGAGIEGTEEAHPVKKAIDGRNADMLRRLKEAGASADMEVGGRETAEEYARRRGEEWAVMILKSR